MNRLVWLVCVWRMETKDVGSKMEGFGLGSDVWQFGTLFVLSTTSLPMSSSTLTTTTRPIVFMDINIGETPIGRLKMELFNDICPK